MSTYLYLECLDHDPPLRSQGESGQHLYDLADIRADIADRDALVSLATRLGYLDLGHWFRNNSAAFLTAHPRCRIGIRDEYGNEHQITEGTDR